MPDSSVRRIFRRLASWIFSWFHCSAVCISSCSRSSSFSSNSTLTTESSASVQSQGWEELARDMKWARRWGSLQQIPQSVNAEMQQTQTKKMRKEPIRTASKELWNTVESIHVDSLSWIDYRMFWFSMRRSDSETISRWYRNSWVSNVTDHKWIVDGISFESIKSNGRRVVRRCWLNAVRFYIGNSSCRPLCHRSAPSAFWRSSDCRQPAVSLFERRCPCEIVHSHRCCCCTQTAETSKDRN